MPYKLKVEDISKQFEEKIVLKDVSLEIPAGTITTILGGSGSGKSVFIKIMIGLIKQDFGIISCDNQKLESKKDFKNFYKKISVLFQNNALFDSMTIQENVLFPFINNKNYDKHTINKLCDESISSVGLDLNIKRNSTSEISGGMQKRVALARAIITKPEIIFLDEPTSGLDVENSKLIFELIKNLSIQYKITAIIITHDVFLAPIISNKIVFLEKGKINEVDEKWIMDKFKIHEKAIL